MKHCVEQEKIIQGHTGAEINPLIPARVKFTKSIFIESETFAN